jgi:methylase of polypeptide subunit release factors
MKVRYGKIQVDYLPSLDGGGSTFGQDFVPVVRSIFRRVENLCEFGAGPGFIGFSLLANNLCDRLTLVEINPKAVKACLRTIRINDLADRVSVYESDGLKNVPATEKWDLVVANPPWHKCTRTDFEYMFAQGKYEYALIRFDRDWNTHRQFYANVGRFLRRGGSVLFEENLSGSSPNLWRRMIEKSGLDYVRSFRYRSLAMSRKPRPNSKGPILPLAKAFLRYFSKDKLRRSFDLGYRESLPLLPRIAFDFKGLGRVVVDPGWQAVRYSGIAPNSMYFVWSRLHQKAERLPK